MKIRRTKKCILENKNAFECATINTFGAKVCDWKIQSCSETGKLIAGIGV